MIKEKHGKWLKKSAAGIKTTPIIYDSGWAKPDYFKIDIGKKKGRRLEEKPWWILRKQIRA